MAPVDSLPATKTDVPKLPTTLAFARKRQETALTAAQCGYALTQVHPGNGQTPPSALPRLCRDVP